ncbi:MAG: hypothetical protein E6R03_00090 [Hyphomicrobiaceae bacterium]|nr:MAG: hypothetical protein E6R03_00090 [Hyphomicrobiaceae bacterium]
MVKIYVALAAAVTLGLAFVATYQLGYSHGADGVRAKIAQEVREKLNAAQTADDTTTRCLADPTCRLSNDGLRRD